MERAGIADHVASVLAIVAVVKAAAVLNNMLVLAEVREFIITAVSVADAVGNVRSVE